MSGSLGSITGGGGVNAEIPLQAGRNPLAAVGDFARTLGAIQQTKLFPGQLSLQQQAVQGGAATLAQHLNQVGANAMIPALADPDLTMAKLTHYAGAAEHIAGGTTQGILGQVAAVPFAPDTPEWKSAVRAIIASQAQTSPPEAVAQVAGVPSTQQVGPALVAGTTAPAIAGGGFRGGTSTPLGLSPEAEAQRTIVGYDKDNNPVYGPLGSVTPGNRLFGGSNGRYQPNATSPGNPALRNPGNGPATSLPAPAGSPAGAVVQPGAAMSSNQATQGVQSAEKFQGVAAEATQAKEQDAVLANMQNDLQNFTAGPGAHNFTQLQKVMQGWVPGLNSAFKTKIAAQESFDKLANQLVTTAAPGSDARQAVIQGANPNSAQSPEGVDFILRQLRGMLDYKLARANLAAAPGTNRLDYSGWQADVGGQLNPQVFQFARLTPDQRRLFFEGIPAGAPRESFKRQYLAAKQAGFYGVDNGSQ